MSQSWTRVSATCRGIAMAGYAAFGNGVPGNMLAGPSFAFRHPLWLINMANAAVFVHILGAWQVGPRSGYLFYPCTTQGLHRALLNRLCARSWSPARVHPSLNFSSTLLLHKVYVELFYIGFCAQSRTLAGAHSSSREGLCKLSLPCGGWLLLPL